MDVDIVNTFILDQKQYSCIFFDLPFKQNFSEEDENDGDDWYPFSLDEFGIEKGELYHDDYIPRISATYEFSDEILYFKGMTIRKEAFSFTKIRDHEIQYSANGKLATYIIGAKLEWNGRIRLARNPVKGWPLDAEDPLAFNTVLDLILSEGRILNINDRSKELEQRRRELKKQNTMDSELKSIFKEYPYLSW